MGYAAYALGWSEKIKNSKNVPSQMLPLVPKLCLKAVFQSFLQNPGGYQGVKVMRRSNFVNMP